MKYMLVIALVLLARLAVAVDYPLYYERFDKNVYSLIIFKNSKTASYLYRINRDDGTTAFFYDPQATKDKDKKLLFRSGRIGKG